LNRQRRTIALSSRDPVVRAPPRTSRERSASCFWLRPRQLIGAGPARVVPVPHGLMLALDLALYLLQPGHGASHDRPSPAAAHHRARAWTADPQPVEQNIINRGTQLLIPPESPKRITARPGWQGGLYESACDEADHGESCARHGATAAGEPCLSMASVLSASKRLRATRCWLTGGT
jgi:hypothetical protein